MANAEKGEASLVAGETTYTLRFGWNEIAEVEDVLGLNGSFFSDLMPKFDHALTIRAGEWRALLWAALRGGGHKDIDLLDAGRLLGEFGIERVGEAIGDAVSAAFPEAGRVAKNPPKASRSTGTKR